MGSLNWLQYSVSLKKRRQRALGKVISRQGTGGKLVRTLRRGNVDTFIEHHVGLMTMGEPYKEAKISWIYFNFLKRPLSHTP